MNKIIPLNQYLKPLTTVDLDIWLTVLSNGDGARILSVKTRSVEVNMLALQIAFGLKKTRNTDTEKPG